MTSANRILYHHYRKSIYRFGQTSENIPRAGLLSSSTLFSKSTLSYFRLRSAGRQFTTRSPALSSTISSSTGSNYRYRHHSGVEPVTQRQQQVQHQGQVRQVRQIQTQATTQGNIPAQPPIQGDNSKPFREIHQRNSSQPQTRNLHMMTENKEEKEKGGIIVLGAGVLGLSTAVTLQKRHGRHQKITIVAAELPSLPGTWDVETKERKTTKRPSADYASMWAGAHYRPIARASRQLAEEYDFALRTREVMLDLIKDDENVEDRCGVAVMPAVELLECPQPADLALNSGDVYAGVGDGFRVLDPSELSATYDRKQHIHANEGKEGKEQKEEKEKEKLKWGCEYTSYCVNVHVYCDWLLRRFVQNGGMVVQTKLSQLEDAFDPAIVSSTTTTGTQYPTGSPTTTPPSPPPIVVNCSGRNFDTDPATKIIRGQTVSVRNQYHRTITRQNADGSWAFLIPRPGGAGTVVGGTKEIGDPQTEPNPSTRKILLENAVRYFPDFVDHVDKFDILTDNVGRRPWREGGLRIETEKLSSDRIVVHGYGAGGRGYEVSWGVAEKIADLVDAAISV